MTTDAPVPDGESPPALDTGITASRAAAWIALAIALAMFGWPLIRAQLPAPGSLPPAETALGYPEWRGWVRGATDLRGQPGPTVAVDRWISDEPALADRVVVIDFWATWCGPCIASIPHMNDLADQFGDRAAFVAVSSEEPAQFAGGLERIGRTPEQFGAALALDPMARMSRAIGLSGIPHILIMSRDGIVRWQGMPGDLDDALLGSIIDADARQAAEAASG